MKIVPMMRGDKDLYDAVDAIGFHYRTNATDDYIKMADVDDKEVWYSEGCATFGYSELQENKTAEYGAGTIGGYQARLRSCLDSFPNAFVGSRWMMYMFQPAPASAPSTRASSTAIRSCSPPATRGAAISTMTLCFTCWAISPSLPRPAGRMQATPPVSGACCRALPLRPSGASSNEHATAGIDGNASYMTLAAPDKQNFALSTVFVNNTRNEKTFAVKLSDMALKAEALHIWTTATDSYMQKGEDARRSRAASPTPPATGLQCCDRHYAGY
ncbi:MAG: hypothetical protein V8S19_01690 [Gemmiger qucibialis]